jgi:CheY-like chemotaxis protein
MNKRILVIDDDLYIRELYEEILKNAGYNVETTIDGQEGIVKLKQESYDLVLLDMMMPKVDGLGVLNELAQNPPAVKNCPIILLSNLGNEPVIKEALQKGATTYLIKADITPDQLLAAVEKYLGKQAL